MKCLTDNGYVKITKAKNGGRFANNVYTIVAMPVKDDNSPCPGIPDTENLDTNNNNIIISVYLSKVAEITKLPLMVIENKFRAREIQHFNLDKVMKEIKKSDFLLGKVSASNGSYVSAEHFLREEYVAKILSRQYRKKEKGVKNEKNNKNNTEAKWSKEEEDKWAEVF